MSVMASNSCMEIEIVENNLDQDSSFNSMDGSMPTMVADEDSETEYQAILDAWFRRHKDRPLTILIAGKSRTGKSTLVNNVLALEGDAMAAASLSAYSVTDCVKVYEGKVRSVNLKLIDAPGLYALDCKNDHKILARLSKITKSNVDLVIYCVNMTGTADGEDVRIISSLTKAFGCEIWKHAVLVLTFANLEKAMHNPTGTSFMDHVSSHAQMFQHALEKAGVTNTSVKPFTTLNRSSTIASSFATLRASLARGIRGAAAAYATIRPKRKGTVKLTESVITAIPAGRNPEEGIKFDGDKWWICLLFEEIFSKCNCAAIPGLLRLRNITISMLLSAIGTTLGAVFRNIVTSHDDHYIDSVMREILSSDFGFLSKIHAERRKLSDESYRS